MLINEISIVCMYKPKSSNLDVPTNRKDIWIPKHMCRRVEAADGDICK